MSLIVICMHAAPVVHLRLIIKKFMSSKKEKRNSRVMYQTFGVKVARLVYILPGKQHETNRVKLKV